MDNSKFLEKLYKEMNIWKKNKIISETSEKKIKDYYKDQPKISGWFSSTRFIQIISVIWVLFVWIWVILFFASNWDIMWDWLKTLVLVLSVLLSYWAGFYLYYKKDWYVKTWYSLVLLGSLLYWASIFLLWQIYNVWWSFYQWMGLWFLWVLPLAYITRFSWLLLLALILFYWFIFWYIDEKFIYFNEDYVLWVIAAISIFFVWLSKLHISKNYSRFAYVYNFMWVLWILVSTFFMTFDVFSFYTSSRAADFGYLLFSFLWIGLVSSFVSYFINKNIDFKEEIWYLIHYVLIFCLSSLIFYINTISIEWKFTIDTNVLMIFFNLYFVALILYCIYLGVSRSKEYLINLWLLFVVIFMIVKYFDWFYDMMDRALFFIWWGLLLVIWWYLLEMKRKKLIQSLNK